MTWPVEQWLRDLEAQHYAASTIRLRGYQLRRFARTAPDPWRVRGGDVAAHLARCPSPEYAKSVKACLHTFYVWAIRTGRTGVDPTVPVGPVRVPPPHARPCPERIYTAALMRAPDGVRLMLLLAGQSGLRRAEIAAVHARDLDGDALWVRGKGGRQRLVPVSDAVRIEMAGRSGWLFPSREGGHLSPDAVGRAVARALGSGWTAHTLRHRAATRGYRASGDLLAVQRLLGHASVATTQRYVAGDDTALRALVDACS
jgi:integrase